MDPETPGKKTSEFSLTAAIMLLGGLMDVTGVLLETIQNAGLAEKSHWLPTTLVVVGTVAALLAKLGYTRSRTMLKLAAAAPLGVNALTASAPFVQAVAMALKQSTIRDILTPATLPDGTPNPLSLDSPPR